MDYKLLGRRIKEERLKLKLTQEQVAEQAAISTHFMGQIERADGIPSLATIVGIANALKTTVDYLLKDSIYERDSLTEQIDFYVNRLNKKDKTFILNVIKAFDSHVNVDEKHR